MAIPNNKSALLQAITDEYERLFKLLNATGKLYAHQPLMEGHAQHTQMSLHNLVAYLQGWGQLVLKWNKLHEAGELLDLPDTGYKWNELGKLAQRFYADYADVDYDKLVERLTQTVAAIKALVESKTNSELYECAWYKQWSLGRMIQLNTSSPYKNAYSRIRKWKKVNGIDK